MMQVPVAVALFYGGPIAMHVFQQDAAVSRVSWAPLPCLTHSAWWAHACGLWRHCMLDALVGPSKVGRTPNSAMLCAVGADVHAWDAARSVAIHLELRHHEGMCDRVCQGGTSLEHQVRWSWQRSHKHTCSAPGAESRISRISTAAAAPCKISIAGISTVTVNLASQGQSWTPLRAGSAGLRP